MIQTAFITGTSRGLGKALAETLLEKEWAVYGLSRSSSSIDHENYHHRQIDLAKRQSVYNLDSLDWPNQNRLDLLILNAGMLGPIEEIHDSSFETLDKIMQVNLWANKTILDSFFKRQVQLDQVIAISSGASVNPFKGWSGYAISKSALNMLIRLYSFEFPQTHFCSLAPGLVDTDMQEFISNKVSIEKFPGVKRLIEARSTGVMPTAKEAAGKILDALPEIKTLVSGEYADIRKL